MNESQDKSLQELRHAGYGVIIWTPEEIGDANPRKVEDRLIEMGWQVIEDLGGPGPDLDDEDDEDGSGS